MGHAVRHTGSRFIAAWGAVAFACLLGAAPALATITRSSLTVTSPQGSYLVDDQVDSNAEMISLGGTTDGTTGDKVDIRCYSGPGSVRLVGGLAVDSRGGFSFSGSFRLISRATCVLRAVPAGDTGSHPPGSSSPYSGPLLNIGQAYETRVSGGTNANDLEYYVIYASQLAGAFEYSGLGGCSISQSHSYDPVTFGSGDPNNPQNENASQTLDYCNAWFSWANGDTTAGAPHAGEALPNRSELQVDGVNAYVAGNAFYVTATPAAPHAGDAIPGYPTLTYSYSVDPATGDLALDETDQVVRCSPGGLFPPTAASCLSFVPTGIQVRMHIVQTQNGRVAKVTQWFQSVDGQPHRLDLLENNDFYHANLDGELNFPWTGAGMQPYTAVGQVVPGPSAPGPGAFFVKGSAATPDGSPATPQGEVTFSNAPSSETIVGTTNSSQHFSWVDLHYGLTVPAGGSVPLGFTYSNGYSAGQLATDAAGAQAAYRPAVSITSPKSGIDTARPTVSVAGTAADATGLAGVSVNGHTVPVAGNGSWNAVVALSPGINTITAVAGNVFGNTAQAQTTVVYVPPPAVEGLRQAHRKWREPGRPSRRGHPRPAIGTTFSWRLNEPAQLRFVFTTQVPGRWSGRACVAQNRRNHHRGRCMRTVTVGTHNLSAGSGAGKWSFKGRMANGSALKPGSYTVTIVATSPTTGAQSGPARLRFTIVK